VPFADTAVHEAGHAVVLHALGHKLEFISLTMDRKGDRLDGSGYVKGGHVDLNANEPRTFITFGIHTRRAAQRNANTSWRPGERQSCAVTGKVSIGLPTTIGGFATSATRATSERRHGSAPNRR
jgi:hypothetical protein